MDPLHLAMLALGAAALSAAVIGLRLRMGGYGLDRPGHRSLHSRPTPHGGGLGIVAAALAAGAWLGVGSALLLPLGILAMVSAVDDWVHLPQWGRLAVHLAAAAFYLHGGQADAVGMVLQVFVIGWTTNAYNFMDGADGLAGSMAVCGFLAYAAALLLAGNGALGGMCLAVAAGAGGFLAYNWHPAKIFMGDVGSIPLGFLAGAIGCYGVNAGIWPLWFPVLAFAPFLLDSAVTLVARFLRGEKVWEAHREHYYQRMVRLGLTHDQMCARWIVLMLAGALSAVVLLVAAPVLGWAVTAVWLGVLAVLGRRVDAAWRARADKESAPC